MRGDRVLVPTGFRDAGARDGDIGEVIAAADLEAAPLIRRELADTPDVGLTAHGEFALRRPALGMGGCSQAGERKPDQDGTKTHDKTSDRDQQRDAKFNAMA